jgi:hypothetical protein
MNLSNCFNLTFLFLLVFDVLAIVPNYLLVQLKNYLAAIFLFATVFLFPFLVLELFFVR